MAFSLLNDAKISHLDFFSSVITVPGVFTNVIKKNFGLSIGCNLELAKASIQLKSSFG